MVVFLTLGIVELVYKKVDYFRGFINNIVNKVVYNMVDEKELMTFLMEKIYLSPTDIRYNKKYGFCLDSNQYQQFLCYKDNLVLSQDTKEFFIPDLLVFDAKPFHFAKCRELLLEKESFLNLLREDFNRFGNGIVSRHSEDVLKSRIYSEIEGTLSIEAVKTTRKRIDAILTGKEAPHFRNDFIIRNMDKGIRFVRSKPDFDKESLHHLYHLLSDGVLEEDYRLREKDFYRYDEVEVDGYSGCPYERIEECMDSLFSYANRILSNGSHEEKFFLPLIAHYYIVYIHPYFDYNGRTARMISFWLSLLTGLEIPTLVSEAIDQTKSRYYSALRQTRMGHNDMTYFLLYLLSVSIAYFNCYRNIEILEQNLRDKNIVLTETERAYVKKILISAKGKFTYKEFRDWIGSDMSKQAAFKTLNNLEEYGILQSNMGKSKTKLFAIAPDVIVYEMQPK